MFKTPIKRGSIAKKIIFALILFCFVLYPLATEASSSRQKQLDELKRQIAEHQKIVEQKRQEAQSLTNEIAIMDTQIKETEIALEATKIEIDKTNEEIAQKEQELKEQRRILNESMRLMYEESETSLLETLLSSKSFSTVLDRMEYLAVVKGKIDGTIKKIEEIKRELENKNNLLNALKIQQEGQIAAINSQKEIKDRLLAETRGEEALYQEKLAKENKQAKALEYEMARAEEQQRIGGYHGYKCSANPVIFDWPTKHSHKITCDYATCYPGHTGIDIGQAGMSHPPIYAAGNGVVVTVIDVYPNDTCVKGSYGNQVVIDHGGGAKTRYAHLKRGIPVYPRQQVVGGQTIIGYMGSTGNTIPCGCSSETDPCGAIHLHFETIINGIFEDPKCHLR